MVAHSGLFVAPTSGVGASPTDARLALAGLIGVVPQLVQGGVVFQVSTAMQIQVGASVWQLPDPTNALATFLAATDGAFLNFAAGPSTGSRIDLIAVKQNNPENGDADSRANIVILPGTAGAPGVPPAVPAGYFRWADIAVPTNAANAAACTVTVHTPTTFAPPDLLSTSQALLNTVTGVTGQHATVRGDATLANNGDYTWNGTLWAKSAPIVYMGTFTDATTIATGTSHNTTITFPAGMFTVAPTVLVMPASARFTPGVSSITTTSAIVSLANWSGTGASPGVNAFIAIQA
ncbi:MAG: hypothetical protein ABI067_17720 [Leifsonia sp.]